MCVFVCICTHIHTDANTHTHTHTHKMFPATSTHCQVLSFRLQQLGCVNTYTHTYIHTCSDMSKHTHTLTRTYIYTYTDIPFSGTCTQCRLPSVCHYSHRRILSVPRQTDWPIPTYIHISFSGTCTQCRLPTVCHNSYRRIQGFPGQTCPDCVPNCAHCWTGIHVCVCVVVVIW
jgi:hypothetical protein